jgi:hypothetical protein
MFNLQHIYITYEKKLPFIDIVNKSGLLMKVDAYYRRPLSGIQLKVLGCLYALGTGNSQF